MYRDISCLDGLSTTNYLIIVTSKIFAIFLQGVMANTIQYITLQTATFDRRSLPMMLVKIRSLEKNIINIRMLPPCPRLLKCVKILEYLVLKFNAGIVSLKALKESPNFSIWPAKCVLDTSLSLETARVLSAKVVFHHSVTDDNITEEYLIILQWWWSTTTDANN